MPAPRIGVILLAMIPTDVLEARAREMRRHPTPAERRLWRIVRDRRLEACKFRRQVVLGPYIVNFATLDARLIVEVDGGQHAESAYDAERDAWLRAHGFAAPRLWNRHVLEETEGAARAVIAALDARRSR